MAVAPRGGGCPDIIVLGASCSLSRQPRIFYKGFGYSSGLVKLGQIDSRSELFERPGTLAVTVERIEE
jgi:hypothetical protein